ncbi:very short patch repair endonuclease [Bacteroides graminisolvens]|uniref:very short patch repair endonuclease n=1 Tax=Bacteroides graminisolvens TaxID=477666 RepID=UPI00046819B6|nr:very short patch repair endonuclease [Bacteroides graminisolvens]
MDIWTKGKRSEVMAKIRGKNTKPELLVRRFLFSKGYRYRIHVKHLPGTPDIVLPKYNVVIFVHGCFWHGHAVDGRLPHSNLEFWASKIKHNKERDFKNTQKLLSMGWKVITIWECQLKPHEKESTLLALDNLLNKLFLDKYRVEPSSNNNP